MPLSEAIRKGKTLKCEKSEKGCFVSTFIPFYPNQIPHFQLDKVSKGAKIRNGYHQVPHLNQDTNGKVTNSQLDTTNES